MALSIQHVTRLEEVSGGGMAVLSLAITEQGQKVILRELQNRNLLRWRLHRGFVRGTKIRQKISGHPHIVSSLGRGYGGFRPYELIECVDGITLRRLVQHREPRLHEHAIEILHQVAQAIAHMHGRGILHLDVKAENVLIDMNGPDVIAKVTDFDLSRPISDTLDKHRTGTAPYMAPERYKYGRIGTASDVFAFGVMAYDLLTGRMPFQGETETEMRHKQKRGAAAIAPPSRFNEIVTPKQDEVIMRCLEHDPEKRFPSLSYLSREL